MGNCVSASMLPEIAPKIRVVQASEGRVVDVEVPILKVGELMLEFPPGHFVAQLNLHADFLASSTGMRATPLAADADAGPKPGAVYVLFPMPRLHTRITPQELLSFAKLLHLHDQQLTKATYKPSKVHVHGLFTAGTRVAPLAEDDECVEDANLHSSAVNTNYEQACPLPFSFTIQQSEQESLVISSCHGHIGVVKPKPWAPKLQTIMES